MKRLQVLFNQEDPNCEWKYVFCHNTGAVITTKKPKLALKERDLEWFQNNFANYHFRAVKI